MSLMVIATNSMWLSPQAGAQTKLDIPETVTLFKNVKVFNGTENKLHDVDVLVVKNKIHMVAKDIPTSGTWEIDVKTGGAKRMKSPVGGFFEYTFETYSEEKKLSQARFVAGHGRTQNEIFSLPTAAQAAKLSKSETQHLLYDEQMGMSFAQRAPSLIEGTNGGLLAGTLNSVNLFDWQRSFSDSCGLAGVLPATVRVARLLAPVQ